GGDRGSHGQVAVTRMGDRHDGADGFANGLDQIRAIGDLRADRVAGYGTGDFTVFVTPHAVRHQPQACRAVGLVGVLVVVAAQADVGAVSKFNHGQNRAIFVPSTGAWFTNRTPSLLPEGIGCKRGP